MSDVENVIVIGSGPAGYTAALYTARANLSPLVIEGFAWGGLLQQTTDVENYPGFPEGIMGPEMMQKFRDQAERFGARLVTEQAERVELAQSPAASTSVWVGDSEHRARTVVLAMGAEHKKLVRPRRGGARRARRQLLRNLRRGVLQGRADADRRRRRLGDGGGDLPLEVRLQGHRRAPPRTSSAPRRSCSSAHARRQNIELLTPYTRRPSSCPARAARSATPSCRTPRPARSASWLSRAPSSRSATSRSRELVAARSRSTRTATSRPTASPRAPTAPACSPPATSSTTPTARRSPPPASGCEAALDAEWYLRDTPEVPTPEGMPEGDLAEAQWAAPAVGAGGGRASAGRDRR